MTIVAILIRKIYTVIDETISEADIKLDQCVKKMAVAAVITNPFAGIYKEGLTLLYEYGEKLGEVLGKKACEVMGITSQEAPDIIDGYGKAVIVGIDGELEHGHAIIHPRFGAAFRKELGGAEYCKAMMPSTAKLGGPGTKIDIPIHNKNDEWVMSSFNAIEIAIGDAPKNNEILVAVAVSRFGRPLARIG
jgi:Protein of unknown function (DUF1185).